MTRLIFLAFGLCAISLAGCGKGTDSTGDQTARTEAGGDANGASPRDRDANRPPTESDLAEARDAVARYLTGWKNGDPDESFELLTTRAQQEYQKAEYVIVPDPSASANFKIVEAEAAVESGVEEDPADDIHTVQVGATWTDLDERGKSRTENIVFFLRYDNERSWRIFGMAMRLDPRLEPVVLNFENHKEIEKAYRKSDEDLARLTKSRSTSLVVPPPGHNSKGNKKGANSTNRTAKKGASSPGAKNAVSGKASGAAKLPRVARQSNPKNSSLVKPVAVDEPVDDATEEPVEESNEDSRDSSGSDSSGSETHRE